MKVYDKKIRYLDYVERGNKIKNGGFAKLEVQNRECRVHLNIRGLYPTDTIQGELFLHSRGREEKVDTILLRYGTGIYTASWNSQNLAGCGVPYEELDGISIRLSEHRILQNIWNTYKGIEGVSRRTEEKSKAIEKFSNGIEELSRGFSVQAAEKAMEEEQPMEEGLSEEIQAAEEPLEGTQALEKPEEIQEAKKLSEEELLSEISKGLQLVEPKVLEMEPLQVQELAAKEYSRVLPQPDECMEVENAPQEITVEEVADRGKEEKQAQADAGVPLYEDKWKQLQQIYKKVSPFGDKRSYLSISPRDFLILPEKYQGLVSNSFLLHGYYNYGHILLGREEKKDGNIYYLGVPGVYHEREKQVARMFGFEGFEGGSTPYAKGSFGYYMYRVEL